WLLAIEMDRLEHHPRVARRIANREQRGDHRAVTMSPQDAPANPERVEHGFRLLRVHPVKARRQARTRRRLAVAAAIGNHEPPREAGDRMVERVGRVAPAAVQHHDRRLADAEVAIEQLTYVRHAASYRTRTRGAESRRSAIALRCR